MNSVGAVLSTFVAVSAATACRAQTVTLTKRGEDNYSVTFDTRKISEADMKGLLAFAPYPGYEDTLPPNLEDCDSADARYYPCGSRGLDDRNFFRNAEVNLEIGRQQVESLEGLAYPSELEPAVTYRTRLLSFFVWLQQTRLNFYRSGNADDLKTKYEDLDAAKECAAAVDKIEAAQSAREKYPLASFDWHNCMNEAFQKKLGPYPIDSWKAFLKDYGITDRLWSDIDN